MTKDQMIKIGKMLYWLNEALESFDEEDQKTVENLIDEGTQIIGLKLAEAVWETLTLDDLHEQFIFQTLERYKKDPNAFQDDLEVMDLDDDGGD